MVGGDGGLTCGFVRRKSGVVVAPRLRVCGARSFGKLRTGYWVVEVAGIGIMSPFAPFLPLSPSIFA